MQNQENTNQESVSENRRRHFRVNYPTHDRPCIKIRGYEFEVIDVSESGLRFINDQEVKLAKWFRVTLIFLDGQAIERESRLVWRHEDIYGIEFVMPIPYKTILKEQRYLIKLS